MANEIMYFDEGSYLREEQKVKKYVVLAQRVVDFHYQLGDLFPLTTFKQVTRIISDGGIPPYKQMIIDNIPDQEVTKGIKIKREVQLQNLDFPDMSALQSILANLSYDERYAGDKDCLLNDKTIVVNTERLQALKERYTYYADTKELKEISEAHKEVAAALDKLNKLFNKNGAYGHVVSRRATYGVMVDVDKLFSVKGSDGNITGGDIVVNDIFYQSFRLSK